MIPVYTAAEIRTVEKLAIAGDETEDSLIERAASAVDEEIGKLQFSRAVIFAGGGNNGSDALSLALRLIERKLNMIIYATSDSYNEYAKKRLNKIKRICADVREIRSADDICFSDGDLIIDGMLGIGCNREVVGLTADIIRKINGSNVFTVSIDLPSGLNADTGKPMGIAVEADLTVTFSALKNGLIIADGRNYSGKIIVREIGLSMPEPSSAIIEREDIVIPKRKPVSNKGTYGNVSIISGSPTMMGASLLAHESACAALRSGAGYAVLCVPESLKTVYQCRVKEELLKFLADEDGRIMFDAAALDGMTVKARAIVLGMGMGANGNIIKIIEYLSHNFEGTLVIDADGLNALALSPSAVLGHRCKLILTPHIAEFARLECGVFGGKSDRPDTVRCSSLAARLNAVVVMKSATTIISDGKGVWLNVTGTPAMAKAGSGDVLSGMIGAFAATSDPLMAVMRACYEFGKAGERAESMRGETSVLASDIIIKL